MSLSDGGSGNSYTASSDQVYQHPLRPARRLRPPTTSDPVVTTAVANVDMTQAMMQGRLSTLATGGLGTSGTASTYRPTLGGMP